MIFLGVVREDVARGPVPAGRRPDAAPSRSCCRARPATSTTSITTTASFYITTNKGAKNFRVVTAPIADPSEKNWKPFIDHNPAVKIDGLIVLRQPRRRLGA